MKHPQVNQEKSLKSTKTEVKGVRDNEKRLKGSSTFIAKGQKTIPKTFNGSAKFSFGGNQKQ